MTANIMVIFILFSRTYLAGDCSDVIIFSKTALGSPFQGRLEKFSNMDCSWWFTPSSNSFLTVWQILDRNRKKLQPAQKTPKFGRVATMLADLTILHLFREHYQGF